jgi:hypothetical protein
MLKVKVKKHSNQQEECNSNKNQKRVVDRELSQHEEQTQLSFRTSMATEDIAPPPHNLPFNFKDKKCSPESNKEPPLKRQRITKLSRSDFVENVKSKASDVEDDSNDRVNSASESSNENENENDNVNIDDNRTEDDSDNDNDNDDEMKRIEEFRPKRLTARQQKLLSRTLGNGGETKVEPMYPSAPARIVSEEERERQRASRRARKALAREQLERERIAIYEQLLKRGSRSYETVVTTSTSLTPPSELSNASITTNSVSRTATTSASSSGPRRRIVSSTRGTEVTLSASDPLWDVIRQPSRSYPPPRLKCQSPDCTRPSAYSIRSPPPFTGTLVSVCSLRCYRTLFPNIQQ